MKSKKSFLILIILALTVFQVFESHLINASQWSVENISFNEDDAYGWNTGEFFPTSPILQMKEATRDDRIYLRFQTVDITPSSLKTGILSLYFLANPDNTTGSATIYGFKINNMPYMGSNPLHPYTTEYVNIALGSITTSGWRNYTITEILKEISGLTNYTSTNSIGLTIVSVKGLPYRQIWGYDGDPNKSAKLYLEKYTNDKPYNGGWEHGVLVENGTNYDIWEVWNGTDLSGLIQGYQSAKWYPSTGTIGYTVANSVFDNWYISNHEGIEIGNSTALYAIVKEVSTASCEIYKSNNSGISWSQYYEFDTSATSYCAMDIRHNNEMLIVCKQPSSINTWYKFLNLNTTTASGLLQIFTSNSADMVAGVHCYPSTQVSGYQNKTHIDYAVYYRVGAGICYKTWNGTVWSSEYVITAGTFNDVKVCWFDGLDGTEFYVTYGNPPATATYGKYIDHDGSLGSQEDLGIRCLYGWESYLWDTEFDSTGKIFLAYVEHYYEHLHTMVRSAGKTGTWGSIGTISDKKFFEVNVEYNTDFGSGYMVACVNHTDNTKAYVYTGSGSSWLRVKNYTVDAYSYNQNTFNLQTETAIYYQIHWYNCTWMIPTPYYPPDPNPDDEAGWGTGYFSHAMFRTYYLLFGLICFFAPMLIIASRPEHINVYFGALIVMLIGLGILLSVRVV